MESVKIKFTADSEMATSPPNFDISPNLGTDVPGCHSSDKEQEKRGSDNSIVLNINAGILQIGRNNVLNFRSLHDSTPSGNPSKVESSDESAPVLREHWKPRGLLSVGRSRLGFPDCGKDHLVQLLVCKNQNTREVLDIGGHYEVTVAVTYDGATGSSLNLSDYQCKRIKSKTKSDTKASMIGVVGYLFRFHEPDTKYHITFGLNATPPKIRGKKKSAMEHTACETICQISVTLETGPIISSKSGKGKKMGTESSVSPLLALSPPSLSKESTMLYKRSWWVVNQLRSCRNSLKSEDFNKHASDLLIRFTDADTQIAIKLEQSMHACYRQNQPDRALQLIDEAFNFMSEAKNPHFMAGRGYFYQAEILRRQGNLGKAEYCVNLAGQNITACKTSLDAGLIAWERARILTDFIGRTPHRSLQLVNETRSTLEKCIDVCLHVETENSNLPFVKQLLVLVLVAMPILLLDSDSNAARKRTISQKFIVKAQRYLDTLRNKYWSEMTLSDRVYFYLSSSDLEYQGSNFTEAEEFARLAKDMAVEMGLNMEACKAQERLDFMSVITRAGHTIDNSPQQSGSEGENADISSSEAESDWLAAILN